MPPEHLSDAGQDEAIDRFWDQIAQGRARDAGDLDPTTAATLRRLHASDDRPGPDRAFTNRLREELMHAHMHAHASEPFAELRLPLAPGDGIRPLPGRIDRRSFAAHLATAALLLLTLVGSFFAFGIGRPGRLNDVPVFLPALGGTPVAEAVVTETLFDADVDGLPTRWGSAALLRWTFEPNSPPLVIPPADGPQFLVVESGAVVATEAGVEHALAAGDVYTAADPDQVVTIRVSGVGTATLLRGYVAKSIPMMDAVGYRYEWLLEGFSAAMPGGSGRLVLERVTLPPGSALPPQEVSSFVWIEPDAGTLGLTLEGDELPFMWTAGEEQTVRGSDVYPTIPTGTRMTLRNAGDEPLVLHRMTLTPDAAEAAGTPGP
jgi:hypothetical protein